MSSGRPSSRRFTTGLGRTATGTSTTRVPTSCAIPSSATATPTRRAPSPSPRLLRARATGSGVPGPGVRPGRARRRGWRGHLRRHTVAPRRPGPGRPVPRSRSGASSDPPRWEGWRVRRPGGPLDADPQRAARAAHGPPREDGLQPRGIVRRPRAPPPARIWASTAPMPTASSSASG